MLKRIITAAVGLALFLPAIFFSDKVPLVLMCIVALLAAIGSFELCGCFGTRKAFYISIPTYAVTLASMTFVIFFCLGMINFKMFMVVESMILFLYLSV